MSKVLNIMKNLGLKFIFEEENSQYRINVKKMNRIHVKDNRLFSVCDT